jgi:sugar phosphate isomerase/epimerase
MKFSICNEMFEGWKLDEVFQYSAELGYNGVEIAHFTICDSVTEVSKVERERICKSAEKAGVEIVGIHAIQTLRSG